MRLNFKPILIAAALILPCAAGPAQDTRQVNVSVKVIEFQTIKGVETGLSAYFKQRNDPAPYGGITDGNGAITSADLTFPTSTTSGITVFLDNIKTGYGDIEAVLQALVNQNRASILSRPKVLVPVASATPTVIQTVNEVPYESTAVAGSSTVQITEFKQTGVSLTVKALDIVDDDANPNTTNDCFIKLELAATVNEEGQRIVVALDDMLAGTGLVSKNNAISVPEFINRSITTTVWVSHGAVLILGGLYRNTKNKNISTLPWLAQGEDLLNAAVQRVSPIAMPEMPLTTGLGNQKTEDGRRELVFMVKAEVWRPAFTVAGEMGFTEEEAKTDANKQNPVEVITGVFNEIKEIPTGITNNITDNLSDSIKGDKAEEDKGLSSNLGGKQ